ncbi:hypothetical protein GLOTRDRAFT_108013 [Gloeophyllum trabeum ATCC 11539]|uniref:Thioesterase domain-containing protein n=1 Tax=Gloeophyllum trabeum (strain ATCC 11539 / FP-39264 / Madison 617) TaxID=670483 RepID=S7RCP0_GLOTA|nr:uncharacterized protein GLOTRDRAFT_108013 [Gloeophyllum trabeum ATCC 11539]EPQ51970.1 hypothetical protein GLOTRDRAFT_108013 [Gloeophyllum trabeum ATCC 11539]
MTSSSPPDSGPQSLIYVWVNPESLPNYGDASSIGGNAPEFVKQLNNNTFGAYGLGDQECFAYGVGKDLKFVEVDVERRPDKGGRMEATTVAELEVTKNMLNGAGMLHGGCLAYLIDMCCATPSIVLGLIRKINGVGVTQAMNILYHSPAPPGSRLRIISTSITLGGRCMTSRCEVIDQRSGRLIASAFLNKMQPNMARL